MPDVGQQTHELRHFVQGAEWDEARLARVHGRMRATTRRRRVLRGAVIGSAIAAVVALGFWLRPAVNSDAATAVAAPWTAGRDGEIRFEDGSRATGGRDSVLVVTNASPTEVSVDLRVGEGTFEVAPNAQRVFRVRSGPTVVTVLGTRFSVRREAHATRVAVTRGRVRVESPGRARTLVAQQSGVFDDAAPDAALPTAPPEVAPVATDVRAPSVNEAAPSISSPASDADSVAGPASARRERDVAAPTPARDWRALTEQGEFDAAYASLREARVTATSLDVDALFAAADAARLSRHPADSLQYLERIVAVHAADPRAALASFTLGRVLLGDLGRPSDAALAFARARQLSPNGALGQDALAREVEAWHRAGDATQARARALEYVAQHPNGVRIRAVRQYGGLEPAP